MLEVEPYELFLPAGAMHSYNGKRARVLMKRLRNNFSDLVDAIEEFLAEWDLRISVKTYSCKGVNIPLLCKVGADAVRQHRCAVYFEKSFHFMPFYSIILTFYRFYRSCSYKLPKERQLVATQVCVANLYITAHSHFVANVRKKSIES